MDQSVGRYQSTQGDAGTREDSTVLWTASGEVVESCWEGIASTVRSFQFRPASYVKKNCAENANKGLNITHEHNIVSQQSHVEHAQTLL